ncbi:Sensor histidine kinase RegB [Aquimixticola soesokkakensis]|uniref:histidine kinase n=1 Tax=Aquimixticola soesokkakensis TaxID=1519096 RepID=A0A1Y5RAE5_9RHOB|nr:ActS/PrrB/RegB family redox-sensitive histidine kinase [Aquimixticola soesokkakensis]SLN12146.1 Sensor histidine kinase RegB [Aquimixticola soesokkakensis]
MTDTAPPGPKRDNAPLSEERRADWVRLRTLVVLRWIAILGQVTAIVVASLLFDIRLDIGACALVIGASVLVNLVAGLVFPETTRLPERAATLMLLFDLAQLCAMLYLTGGLHNPFALLILAPVTISATALRPQSTALIGGIAILFVTLLAAYYIPLHSLAGLPITMPRLFVFGAWIAIVIGIAFLGVFAWRVASEIHSMSEALLATQMALSREQKLTDLGGVVAAAAHELGTPLATIKLVSSELIDDLSGEQQEDARLINEQADRCRDILRSMGRAGKDDLHMRTAPLDAVIHEAAEPHAQRGKTLLIDTRPALDTTLRQPEVFRRPEIIHGLRNLVQNAVDFASQKVWVEAEWSDTHVSIRIRDDGPGYPQQLIGRIGDPFLKRRAAPEDSPLRPDYEGMGLGLFIAKTLLERTGADIEFANVLAKTDALRRSAGPSGAIVKVTWPHAAICAPSTGQSGPLGENIPFNP